MKKRNKILEILRYICLLCIITFGLMTIVGSIGGGDDGGGGGDTYTGDTGVGDTGVGDTATTETNTTFNISNAATLLAQQETVSAAASLKRSAKDGRPLFTYQIVNQGLKKPLTKEEALEKAKYRSTTKAEGEAGTNLMAVDEDGNAWLAIDSDYPIKVMYTVTDPSGEYVYLALDTGWWNWDGNDYSQFIAKENCAFYKIKIADNTWECVKEGIFVQNMDDNYMKAICGDQKPIQFDDNSNVYFAATEFTREDNSWEECWWDNLAQTDVCTTHTDYWINQTSWNPRLYIVDAGTGLIDDLTPDNTSLNFFIALPTGEIAYQVWNIDTYTGGGLYMWQQGATFPLSSDTWGVNFFTGDTKNAVMWGSWEEYGIRFARPRDREVGIEKATLNTKLFGGAFNDQHSSSPLRIIVGDDGRLYGVFESWQSEYDNNTNDWTYSSVLSVFQILPYDGIPKVELTLTDTFGWWNWMERTPFKVSKGYLYYTESDTVPYQGERDVIRTVKLEDRSSNTILDGEGQRYEIYSWNLSDDTLYFSGLDLSTTTVVTGKIDTLKVRQGALESEYLEVTETASALGASSAVQDIEVLKPRQPESDTGSAPVVEQFHVSSDNIYSASIDFTKYMNKDTVESYLSFKDDDNNTSVEPFNVWIYKSLHLIPDLSDLELGDATTTPLLAGTNYTITLGSGTLDAYDWDLEEASTTFETRPASGWYSSTTDDASGVFSSGEVAKYAGPATEFSKETFVLYETGSATEDVNATGHKRIEFSAKNYGWDGIDVVLWNNTHYKVEHQNDTWVGYDAVVRMGNWTNIDYKTGLNNDWDSNWTDGQTPELFNGSWTRYRVDFYGTNLVVSYSQDGTEFTVAMSVTDFKTRVGNTDDLTFLIRCSNPVVLDNLQVTTLDEQGSALSAGDILDLDFTGAINQEFGTANVDTDYGLNNWW